MAAIIFLASSVSMAEVFNVNINHSSSRRRVTMNGTAYGSTVAPLSYTGTTWTDIQIGSADAAVSAIGIADSDNVASLVDVTLTAADSVLSRTSTYYDGAPPALTLAALDNYNDESGNTLSISGLGANSNYTLYLMGLAKGSANGNDDATCMSATIGAITLGGAGGQSWYPAAYAQNGNYLIFSGITDGTGSITATVSNLGAFQLEVSAPEPATIALLGLGGISLLRRRKR
ncbi:MAG: PEP-CTERM sorting domain-containing protein [Planctomycetota bacterium]|jgi:hypothetical protein